MSELSELFNSGTSSGTWTDAVVIEVIEEGDEESPEYYCTVHISSVEAFSPGDNVDDYFNNNDIIPNKNGLYIFDVDWVYSKDFNGETTEYETLFSLKNCRPYKPTNA